MIYIARETALTLLHLGDQVLVEETSCLLMEWAVNCDNVALRQHVLEIIDTSATNLLLDLWLQWLVIEVQKLLAVEGLETTEHTLADAANSDSADNLIFEVVLVFGNTCNVPVASLDHLVGGNKVSDENEDSHDDMLGDGDNV